MSEKGTTILKFFNKTSEEINLNLQEVRHKLNVSEICIQGSMFFELKLRQFSPFCRLLTLDLSSNFICHFEKDVFATLKLLRHLNLSFNLIETIDEHLFKENGQLETINLNKNLLNTFDQDAFLVLKQLVTLDLSSNQITVVPKNCLNCAQLVFLSLSNNKIEIIHESAFKKIPNLITLNLSRNKLRLLSNKYLVPIFGRLQYLYLNNNLIKLLTASSLCNLEQNGGLVHRRASNLIYLNLFDNDIDVIERETFEFLPWLKSVYLTVKRSFDFQSIKNLKYLTTLKLFYAGEQTHYFQTDILDSFRDKNDLKYVSLTVNCITITSSYIDFDVFKNVSFLHIECPSCSQLKSDADILNIDLIKFAQFSKLETLSLKKITNFTVTKSVKYTCTFQMIRLKCLELLGIQNRTIGNILKNFTQLKSLNLSFSQISEITDDAFATLVHLQTLRMEYSALKSITSVLFENNTNLRWLLFGHCCIETIEDYSFKNLITLKKLDLRNNHLTNVNKLTFFGLSERCQICLLRNPIDNLAKLQENVSKLTCKAKKSRKHKLNVKIDLKNETDDDKVCSPP